MMRPKLHSNNEEWIKPGIVEACIIRVFDLRLQEISWLFQGRGICISHMRTSMRSAKN